MTVAIRGNVRIGGKVLASTTIGDYVAATGATDTTVIANLVAYLKIQNLWDSVRFFPFKSAQNKGSGTTVYGLGGWTSNNVTLVNGPTWGANGVAFDATDDRATWDGTGIETLSELYLFDVQKPVGASAANVGAFGGCSFGDVAATKILYHSFTTSALGGETMSSGVTAGSDIRWFGSTVPAWSAGAKTQIVTRYAASGFGIWQSKISEALDKTSGMQSFAPSSAGWTTDSILNINCRKNTTYGVFPATTRVALLLCKTSLTQAQREAITDYLDAL